MEKYVDVAVYYSHQWLSMDVDNYVLCFMFYDLWFMLVIYVDDGDDHNYL